MRNDSRVQTCPCGGPIFAHKNERKDGSGEIVWKCDACGRREVMKSWPAKAREQGDPK